MNNHLPERLDQDRHVRMQGRARGVAGRRVVMAVLAVVVALALANVFGQDSTTSSAQAEAAQLKVRIPPHLRGGLLFQGRIDVTARDAIERPVIELGEGWIEEIQANTVAPSPESETSRHDRWVLEYPSLRAGERLTVWLQFGVNPTGAGRRDQSVRLLDGDEQIAAVSRRVTVFP
jgi:hypothetical protein